MAYLDQWGRITNVPPRYQYGGQFTNAGQADPNMRAGTGTRNVGVPANEQTAAFRAGQMTTQQALPATTLAAATNTNAANTTAAGNAFDWRQGLWQAANRWNPTWAAQNAWNTITDPKTVVAALNAARPGNAAALGQWQTDLKYINAGQANTMMPSWYGIATQNPGSFTQPGTPSTNPLPTTYQPGPDVPYVDWSKFNWGTGATNPLSGGAGTPSWQNDPNWASNPKYAKEAQTWAAVMVPWLQAQQNAYQYQQDFNEAQRRANEQSAWQKTQDQFTMDQAVKTADYQKQRDAEEFKLGRQQVWGRNIAPNTKWMRSWS